MAGLPGLGVLSVSPLSGAYDQPPQHGLGAALRRRPQAEHDEQNLLRQRFLLAGSFFESASMHHVVSWVVEACLVLSGEANEHDIVRLTQSKDRRYKLLKIPTLGPRKTPQGKGHRTSAVTTRHHATCAVE